ncbi:hypothetical protein [Paramagnetospirillum marisnigri]|nr:hypothetical protein [Paramagnetospirillum marisnigri]
MTSAADPAQTELRQMASVAIKLAMDQGVTGPFAIVKAIHRLRQQRPELTDDQAFILACGAWAGSTEP